MFVLARRRNVASALVVSLFALGIAAGGTPASASGQPWRNPHQPAEKRADELLAALSKAQKIQLALVNFAALASFGVPVLNADDGPNGVRATGTTAMPRRNLAGSHSTQRLINSGHPPRSLTESLNLSVIQVPRINHFLPAQCYSNEWNAACFPFVAKLRTAGRKS